MTFPKNITPAELIFARCRAFEGGDFGTIFDSYHPESFFRRQFHHRQEYLDYGASTLSTDFSIRECRILHEQVLEEEARVIFYLDAVFQGNRLESFELALFRRIDEQWRYYATQKMERQEFQGKIEEIGWSDFEKVKDRFFF